MKVIYFSGKKQFTISQEDGILQKKTGRLAWLLWRSAYFIHGPRHQNQDVVLKNTITNVSEEFYKEPTYW